jgi:phosphatidylserine decarboxylase
MHSVVSRVYTRLYETRASKHFIAPYCQWQYGDREHYRKFMPGRNKVDYESFQDFFTRDFKEPVSVSSESIWPCEGEVCDVETPIASKQVNIKGDVRPIRTIFGEAASLIPDDYHFTNVFLHNKNYHHIHAPVTGKILRLERIPGKLLLLRPRAYPGRPSLPALHNERVNLDLEDGQGRRWFLSIVGGPAVATIRLPEEVRLGATVTIGQKIASFHMGSTCCIASPIAPSIRVHQSVSVGQPF